MASTLIADYTYNSRTKTLNVEFANGCEYQFFDVPKEIHIEMTKCESLGKYFNESIKNKFEFKKIKS